MTKNYIIHINGSQHFLFTTDENAKLKRLLTRRMCMDERQKGMSTMQLGVFHELEPFQFCVRGIFHDSNTTRYKKTEHEALVWLANATTVTWDDALWDEESQAFIARPIFAGEAGTEQE